MKQNTAKDKATILEELEKITPLLPTPIYWEDVNSVVIGFNKLVQEGIGAEKAEDILGKTPYEFYPHEMADHIVKHNEEVMLREEILTQDESIKDVTTGKIKHYTAVKAPLYDDEGNTIGVVGTSIDITERVELEQKLKTANQKIAQLNKTLKIYAASQAHELRTPLATIAMQVQGLGDFVDKLLEGYNIAKEAGLEVPAINKRALNLIPKVIGTVENEVQRSNAIIDTTLSQIDLHDKKIPIDQECSMRACIEEALARHPFQSDAERGLVHFDTESDFKFIGSHTLMVHIIFNLLKNALHYIHKNDKGNITITLTQGKLHNRLTFTDTAEGIKSENVEKVFQEFFSEREKGTGVGLAFCHDVVVNKFLGAIRCESVYGEFVSFIIELPAVVQP